MANLKENLENIYNALQSSEKLLRLLHYMPKNASDDPLSISKQDVSALPKRYEIIANTLVPSDKTYDLDLESKICRLCVYTGTRRAQQNFNQGMGQLNDNVYASDQVYNFDVYAHIDVDVVDFRMMWIVDTVNEILFQENVTDIGRFRLAFSSPINNTPKGYVGYKLAYVMSSSQEPRNRRN